MIYNQFSRTDHIDCIRGKISKSLTHPELLFKRVVDIVHDLLLSVSGITFLTSTPPSPHIHQVSDAVVDALTSQSPRDRYLVGFDAWFITAGMARLPTFVADFVITRVLCGSIVPRGRE